MWPTAAILVGQVFPIVFSGVWLPGWPRIRSHQMFSCLSWNPTTKRWYSSWEMILALVIPWNAKCLSWKTLSFGLLRTRWSMFGCCRPMWLCSNFVPQQWELGEPSPKSMSCTGFLCQFLGVTRPGICFIFFRLALLNMDNSFSNGNMFIVCVLPLLRMMGELPWRWHQFLRTWLEPTPWSSRRWWIMPSVCGNERENKGTLIFTDWQKLCQKVFSTCWLGCCFYMGVVDAISQRYNYPCLPAICFRTFWGSHRMKVQQHQQQQLPQLPQLPQNRLPQNPIALRVWVL